MRNNDTYAISSTQHPLLSAFFFLLTAFIAFAVIGPLIGTFILMGIYDGDMNEILNKLQDPFNDPSFRKYYFLLQGSATGIGLILIPWVYLKFVTKRAITFLSPVKKVIPSTLVLTVLVVFSFIVVNSLFIEWNSNLELPDSMSGLESWMRQTESQAAKLTEYMTTFDSTGELLIALLVIAVLPAIGEELVFRGFIQTELRAGFGNPHVAIWLSAFLFSAIHMQFFGFFPRLFLGALFGYLYLWSGNLAYPILAHFVNNASQLLLLYFVQIGVAEIDLESTESFPTIIIIGFTFITFGLLYYFRRLHNKAT